MQGTRKSCNATNVALPISVRTKVCRYKDGVFTEGVVIEIKTSKARKQRVTLKCYVIQFDGLEQLVCDEETVRMMMACYASRPKKGRTTGALLAVLGRADETGNEMGQDKDDAALVHDEAKESGMGLVDEKGQDENDTALPPPPLSTPTTTQNLGQDKDDAALVHGKVQEAKDSGMGLVDEKGQDENDTALLPPPLRTPTTTQNLDWNNVEVMQLFIQHMQNPQVGSLYNPPPASLMPARTVEDILAREPTQNLQLMHKFVEYMQSHQDNKARVPMTGNKRKKDDEGNSNNATVKKRKKVQRKHKKRQNTKEEVHIVNEATRESDQDSCSGTYLDCGVCCGRGM